MILDELSVDERAPLASIVRRLTVWTRTVRLALRNVDEREIKTVRITPSTGLPVTINTRFASVRTIAVIDLVRTTATTQTRHCGYPVQWQPDAGNPRITALGTGLLDPTYQYDVTFEIRGEV